MNYTATNEFIILSNNLLCGLSYWNWRLMRLKVLDHG